MGLHGEGNRRSGTGCRPRSYPLAHPLPVCGFSFPLPCGPSPGDDPFECLAVIYFIHSPQQHILLLALGPWYSLSPVPIPLDGNPFYVLIFFPGSLLFLCAIFKVVWMGKQPTTEVGGAFFFLDTREARKGLAEPFPMRPTVPAVQGALTVPL